MKIKNALFLLMCIFLSSCYTLREPTITRNMDIGNYQYFLVSETGEKTGTSSAVYGNQYGVYGGGETKSVNPADIITGTLIKKGYVKLTDILGVTVSLVTVKPSSEEAVGEDSIGFL